MRKKIRDARIPIHPKELDKFFTVDANGNRLTLGDYIARAKTNEASIRRGYSCVDARGAERTTLNAGDRRFGSDEIELLVDQYLESIPDDEVFEIVGLGSFTKEELREEIRKGTTVGLRVTQMILDDRNFVEEQIRHGRFKEVS